VLIQTSGKVLGEDDQFTQDSEEQDDDEIPEDIETAIDVLLPALEDKVIVFLIVNAP
jgi:hypothetical protein